MGTLKATFDSEVGFVCVIILVVCLLIFPMPTYLLDYALAANIFLAVLLLIRALQLSRPEEFSTLPSLLLFSTVLRLGLNVATTRQLIAFGEAPEIVRAFGEFVTGGSLLAGLTVFFILTLVQFLVVTKGAERVAEVAARFALDALPGRQLAIDAELRSGVISQELARTKRDELSRESRLYGALDGAMKFVKGDTIAGLVIIAINLSIGMISGVLVHKLEVSEAVERYSMLTIGDGLAAQLPALLVSTAAAVVISRVSGEGAKRFSSQIGFELCGDCNALKLVALIGVLFGFVPGIPLLPCALLSISSLLVARNSSEVNGFGAGLEQQFDKGGIEVIVCGGKQGAENTNQTVRAQADEVNRTLFEQTGLIFPQVLIRRQRGEIGSISYHGRKIFSSELAECDSADAPLIAAIVAQHAHRLLDDSFTERLCEYYAQSARVILGSCVPSVVTVTELTLVFQSLLEEGIPIHGFPILLQRIAQSATQQELQLVGRRDYLLAESRTALAELFVPSISEEGAIGGWVVSSELDQMLVRAALEDIPVRGEIRKLLIESAARVSAKVVVATKYARRRLWEILYRSLNDVRVLCPEEFPDDIAFVSLGILGANVIQSSNLEGSEMRALPLVA